MAHEPFYLLLKPPVGQTMIDVNVDDLLYPASDVDHGETRHSSSRGRRFQASFFLQIGIIPQKLIGT